MTRELKFKSFRNPFFLRLKKTGLFSVLVLALIHHPGYAAENKTVIRGFIESYEWNDSNIIVQVSILVDPSDPMKKTGSSSPIKYEDYVVMNTEKGKELFQYIGEYVEAKGIVSLDTDSTKMIDIESYKIIKEQKGKTR